MGSLKQCGRFVSSRLQAGDHSRVFQLLVHRQPFAAPTARTHLQAPHLHPRAVPEQMGPISTTSESFPQPKGRLQSLIARYGTGAFLAYITFSNILSVGMLCTAWIFFWHTSGVSPLQQGQWPKFLAFYTALWAAQQVSRPMRLGVGLALAPLGDGLLAWTAKRLKKSIQGSLGVLLVLEAILLLSILGLVALFTSGGMWRVAWKV